MKIKMNIDYKPSVKQIAEAIWDMTVTEQVYLLEELSSIGKPEEISVQLQAIKCQSSKYTKSTKSNIAWFIEKLNDYLADIDEEKVGED